MVPQTAAYRLTSRSAPVPGGFAARATAQLEVAWQRDGRPYSLEAYERRVTELKDEAEDWVVEELSMYLPIEAARDWGSFCHVSLNHDSTKRELVYLIDAAVALSDLDHHRAILWYSILADRDLALSYDSWGYEPAEVSDLISGCCRRLFDCGEVSAADRERLDHLEGFLRARIPACRIRSYGVLGVACRRPSPSTNLKREPLISTRSCDT